MFDLFDVCLLNVCVIILMSYPFPGLVLRWMWWSFSLSSWCSLLFMLVSRFAFGFLGLYNISNISCIFVSVSGFGHLARVRRVHRGGSVRSGSCLIVPSACMVISDVVH